MKNTYYIVQTDKPLGNYGSSTNGTKFIVKNGKKYKTNIVAMTNIIPLTDKQIWKMCIVHQKKKIKN